MVSFCAEVKIFIFWPKTMVFHNYGIIIITEIEQGGNSYMNPDASTPTRSIERYTRSSMTIRVNYRNSIMIPLPLSPPPPPPHLATVLVSLLHQVNVSALCNVVQG